MIVERRCVNPVSAEAFDLFSQEEVSESCGNSWVIFGMNLLVCLAVIL